MAISLLNNSNEIFDDKFTTRQIAVCNLMSEML